MISRNEYAKRQTTRRPQFNLRCVGVFLTLFCLYFAAWQPTKKYGIEQLSRPRIEPIDNYQDDLHFGWATSGGVAVRPDEIRVMEVLNASSPAPLIVTCIEFERMESPGKRTHKRTYFWLFGLPLILADSIIPDP